jgi:uncharacterized membrane-anchored protein
MKSVVFWCLSAAVVVTLNWLIWEKEILLDEGQTMFLRLAPRDPRSLIQGDYMVLRYEIAGEVAARHRDDLPARGNIVVRLDSRDVARFVRLDRGGPLDEGERLLAYKRRGRLRLGAESFFFQEGHAKHYESAARYGELKVAPSGKSVLVGLRDENLEPLGP